MKFLPWFLKFFTGAPGGEKKKYVKFVAGTEWTCVCCHTVLGVAKRDVYYGDLMSSSEWEILHKDFWTRRHCDTYAFRISPGGRMEFHTPTGWVG